MGKCIVQTAYQGIQLLPLAFLCVEVAHMTSLSAAQFFVFFN